MLTAQRLSPLVPAARAPPLNRSVRQSRTAGRRIWAQRVRQNPSKTWRSISQTILVPGRVDQESLTVLRWHRPPCSGLGLQSRVIQSGRCLRRVGRSSGSTRRKRKPVHTATFFGHANDTPNKGMHPPAQKPGGGDAPVVRLEMAADISCSLDW